MWWYVLELSPDADEATVRRTYAKLMKEVDQDLEIERFTKIHHAYRMAMKSFKDEKKRPTTNMYQGDDMWYMESLEAIYDDPEKRLNPTAWRHVFDCMSFTEEERFASEYLAFFNAHYFLTDEVWDTVEGHYPIMKHKAFMWADLVGGNFSVSSQDLPDLNANDLTAYVEGKIRVFNNILRNDYKEAKMLLETLVHQYPQVDLLRMQLMVMVRTETDVSDIEMAYKRLLADENEANLARYHYGSWLMNQDRYKEAVDVLSGIEASERWRCVTLLLDEARQHLAQSFERLRSWMQIDYVDKKHEKHLAKGYYKKVLSSI